MIDLTQVMTFSEAAQKWGFANGNTLRKAVERKRFRDNEIRKSGDVWLTTYEAMVRVFGSPKQNTFYISYDEIADFMTKVTFDHENVCNQLKTLYDRMELSIKNNQIIAIIKNQEHPEQIFMIIRTQEELHSYWKQIGRYLNVI